MMLNDTIPALPEFLHQTYRIVGCEVCYRSWTEDAIIAVNGIHYLNSKRITPWFVCPECAERISDALAKKNDESRRNDENTTTL